MTISIHFHWKRALSYTAFVTTTCFLLFLILLLRDADDDILTFDPNELNPSQAQRILNLEDTFNQPVPDITRLRYHQNSAKPCSINTPNLLAVVHSAPSHFLHRKAIRRTWGSFTGGMSIRTIFVIGRSSRNLVWQRTIQEASNFGDIVLVDMPDSYNNLTLKHLVGLHWSIQNCPDVSYILKADDDAFIDMNRVEKIITPNLPLNTIACRIVPSGSEPKRSGKWKVTRNDYPFDDYPEYCSGLAYFSRQFTMIKVFKSAMSRKVPYLWIDDVFLTGFSAEHAGVKRMDLSVWFSRTDEQVLKWLKNERNDQDFPWMVAELSPTYWPSYATAVWNKTLKARELKTV